MRPSKRSSKLPSSQASIRSKSLFKVTAVPSHASSDIEDKNEASQARLSEKDAESEMDLPSPVVSDIEDRNELLRQNQLLRAKLAAKDAALEENQVLIEELKGDLQKIGKASKMAIDYAGQRYQEEIMRTQEVRVNEVFEELREQKSEMRAMEATMNDMVKQIQRMSAEKEEMEREMLQKEAMNEQLEQISRSSANTVSLMEEKNESLQQTIRNLKAKLEQLTQVGERMNALKEADEANSQRIAHSLRVELGESVERESQIKSDLEALRKEMETLRMSRLDERENYKLQMRIKQNEAVTDKKEAIKRFRQKIRRLNETVTAIKYEHDTIRELVDNV